MSSLPMTERTSEPTQAAVAAAVNNPLLRTTIPPDLGAARHILEEYSGIAPEDVNKHLLDIRERAWKVFPYGCVASFSFVHPASALDDSTLKAIIARLKLPNSTETLLDVGCALGSFIRHLIVQGIPAARLYGTDLHPGFLELGYELFRDRGTEAKFLAGDMLDDEGTELEGLEGKIDIIHAAAFFHLFELEGQLKAARRMVGFLNPENPRVMIFGTNGGPKVDDGWEKYVLDAEGWQGLWDDVGRLTGTEWKTTLDLEETETAILAKFTVCRAGVGGQDSGLGGPG